MAKAAAKNLNEIGNENSYTPEFFETLYKKIGLTPSPRLIISKIKTRIIPT